MVEWVLVFSSRYERWQMPKYFNIYLYSGSVRLINLIIKDARAHAHIYICLFVDLKKWFILKINTMRSRTRTHTHTHTHTHTYTHTIYIYIYIYIYGIYVFISKVNLNVKFWYICNYYFYYCNKIIIIIMIIIIMIINRFAHSVQYITKLTLCTEKWLSNTPS